MSDSLPPPWTEAHQAPLSFTISQRLLEFMYVGLVMLSNHLIFCCLWGRTESDMTEGLSSSSSSIFYYPFLLLLSIFPSIRVFSNELVLCIRWSNCEQVLPICFLRWSEHFPRAPEAYENVSSPHPGQL